MHFHREILAYIDFSEEDAARIKSLREDVAPHFETIVDAFYESLWSNPRTRAVFESEEQVERLRGKLMQWLEELFTGPYDEDYFERHHHIGKVHVDVGLLPHFMFGAMNIIRRHITRLIARHEQMGRRERAAHAESVEKLLDLELTLMVQSYWDSMMELKLQIPAALATGLAHEIRNPLNALNLNVTLMERRLKRALEDTSEFDSILEVMRSEIRRIRGMTGEIMDFARPIKLAQGWHDGRQLLRELEMIHGPALDASDIALEIEFEGPDPIWCDIDRLKQVLVNLLTNAIEAIGEQGRVELRVRNDADTTLIELSDDGAGMPPGLRYQIFDLFYTTKASGTGLGLPIIQKIVEAHDGAVDVQSREGEGTTFMIHLPRPRTSHQAHRVPCERDAEEL